MSGPENRYLQSINRLLPDSIHREKMHNPYRGGTFDMWYSGKLADLWIEYKWVNRMPKKGVLIPELSELQKKWGRGRQEEGRNVAVVVGSPIGGVWFIAPTEWEGGLEDVSNILQTKQEIAGKISALTSGEGINGSSGNSGRRSKRHRISVQNTDRRVSDIRADQVSAERRQAA